MSDLSTAIDPTTGAAAAPLSSTTGADASSVDQPTVNQPISESIHVTGSSAPPANTSTLPSLDDPSSSSTFSAATFLSAPNIYYIIAAGVGIIALVVFVMAMFVTHHRKAMKKKHLLNIDKERLLADAQKKERLRDPIGGWEKGGGKLSKSSPEMINDLPILLPKKKTGMSENDEAMPSMPLFAHAAEKELKYQSPPPLSNGSGGNLRQGYSRRSMSLASPGDNWNYTKLQDSHAASPALQPSLCNEATFGTVSSVPRWPTNMAENNNDEKRNSLYGRGYGAAAPAMGGGEMRRESFRHSVNLGKPVPMYLLEAKHKRQSRMNAKLDARMSFASSVQWEPGEYGTVRDNDWYY